MNRRTLLSLASGTLAGLAGCIGDQPQQSRTDTPAPTTTPVSTDTATPSEPLCTDPVYDLGPDDSLEFDHYGRWEVVHVDGQKVDVLWSITADRDGVTWAEGDVIEIEGETFDVGVDGTLVLDPRGDGQPREYEVGEIVEYQRNRWGVAAVEDGVVHLDYAGHVDHRTHSWRAGEEVTVAAESYVVDVTDDGRVLLCAPGDVPEDTTPEPTRPVRERTWEPIDQRRRDLPGSPFDALVVDELAEDAPLAHEVTFLDQPAGGDPGRLRIEMTNVTDEPLSVRIGLPPIPYGPSGGTDENGIVLVGPEPYLDWESEDGCPRGNFDHGSGPVEETLASGERVAEEYLLVALDDDLPDGGEQCFPRGEYRTWQDYRLDHDERSYDFLRWGFELVIE